jgi:hypothetical protein
MAALEYRSRDFLSKEDRGTFSRIRSWMNGGVTVLAACRVDSSLGPLVVADDTYFGGGWIGNAGDVDEINQLGFEILVRNRHLMIDGEIWDAVITVTTYGGGLNRSGHYVAQLGRMTSPVYSHPFSWNSEQSLSF